MPRDLSFVMPNLSSPLLLLCCAGKGKITAGGGKRENSLFSLGNFFARILALKGLFVVSSASEHDKDTRIELPSLAER